LKTRVINSCTFWGSCAETSSA